MMAQSPDSPTTIDLLALLKRQNYYQRLGLKTNAVTAAHIDAAYAQRMILLQECQAEIDEATSALAASLITQACETLRDPEARRTYDSQLQTSNRWKGEGGAYNPTHVKGAANPGKRTLEGESILARYQVGNVLYRGLRSTIYDAVDSRVNRPVVIKRMHCELGKSANHPQQFQDEAEQFARFTSGHLVKVLDYDAKTASIVMEKLQCDLREMVKPKGVDWRVAIAILADCLEGLCELHDAGMSHTRIDLSHIMIDAHGGAKLTLTPGMRRGRQSLLPGVQSRYIAPELLNPSVFGEPGPNADIYSLGFVTLELIVGSAFPQRVSKSISSDDDDPTSWLQWHASPTDHLPSIDSLVPDLHSVYADFLKRMTCKKQHDRFQTAGECLSALREIQTSLEPKHQEESNGLQTLSEDHGVDLLGQPAPLHARYELPTALTWAAILRDPSAIFRDDASRHRLALLSMGAIAALLLVVVGLQAPNESGAAEDFVADSSAAPENDTLNLGDYHASFVEEDFSSITDSEANTEAETEPNPPSPPEFEAHEYSQVDFIVVPEGRVVDVVPLEGVENHLAFHSDEEGNWSLAPGKYSVRYELTQESAQGVTEVVIPDNARDMRFVLQVTPVEKKPPLEEPRVQPVPRQLPSFYARPEVTFPLVPTASLTSPELGKQLDAFLNSFIDQKSEISDLSKRASKPGNRDPRVSFAYALQAVDNQNYELAIEQCRRALREARAFDAPFILPLELLCHLELERGGKGLQVAHAECRRAAEWIQTNGTRRIDARFQQSLEHLAWWTGTVVGFIETTRNSDLLANVDLEPSKILYREELGGRYAELFDGAIQKIESRYQAIIARNRSLEDHHWVDRLDDMKRKLLHEQHDHFMKEEDSYATPRGAVELEHLSSLSSSTMQSTDSEARMELVRESGSDLLAHVEQRPRRPDGPRVSVTSFREYIPRDLSMFAQETRKTIPEPESRNTPGCVNLRSAWLSKVTKP